MQSNGWQYLRPDDCVVVCAHNEAASIAECMQYVLSRSLRNGHVVLVDSNCTDSTVAIARATAGAMGAQASARLHVLKQEESMQEHRIALTQRFALTSWVGKGAAMWAAILHLTKQQHGADTRVFFLDGDIVNYEESDPIGTLLLAWESNPEARIAKLADQQWDERGYDRLIREFLRSLPGPYAQLAGLGWPLCGQQAARLGDLRHLPIPCRYSVEVALLLGLTDLSSSGMVVHTQKQVPATLVESRAIDLEKYGAMYPSILRFSNDILQHGGLLAHAREDVLRSRNERAAALEHDPKRSLEYLLPPAICLAG